MCKRTNSEGDTYLGFLVSFCSAARKCCLWAFSFLRAYFRAYVRDLLYFANKMFAKCKPFYAQHFKFVIWKVRYDSKTTKTSRIPIFIKSGCIKEKSQFRVWKTIPKMNLCGKMSWRWPASDQTVWFPVLALTIWTGLALTRTVTFLYDQPLASG